MNLNRILIILFGLAGLLLIHLRIEDIVNKWLGGLGFLLIAISTYLAGKIQKKN
jgi:hypothetical protein